jgi:hypothetical protein
MVDRGGDVLDKTATRPDIGGDVLDKSATWPDIGGDVLDTTATFTDIGGDVLDNAATLLKNGGDGLNKAAIGRPKGASMDPIEAFVGVIAAALDERNPVADNYHKLHDEVRRLTGTWTYPALASLTGESLRNIQRHHGVATGEGMAKLILAAHAKDPDLARRFAVAGGHDLQKLGIAPAPSPLAAPQAAPPGTRDAKTPAERHRQNAESVLLAAAHAANLPPEAVRPAVAAALARARDLGANPADLAAHLAKPLGAGTKG